MSTRSNREDATMATTTQYESGSVTGLPKCPANITGKPRDILEAAAVVFLREGFERASVDVIAAEANVSKRTIYNHFADKRALFLDVISYKLHPGALIAALDPELLTGSGTIRRDLERMGRRVVDQELHEDVSALRRVLISDVIRFPELTGACQHLYPGAAIQQLGARLHSLFPDRLTVELAITAISQFLGIIFAHAQSKSAFWAAPVAPDVRDRFIAEAADLIVRAYNLEG